MEYRKLGRTGIQISEIGFGCGNVGGLMIRGEPAGQVRAAARAVELGINYFDTASSYGDGRSERNLGRVLKELTPNITSDIYVGTKLRLRAQDMGDIKGGVIKAVEESLERMQLKSVDLIQLHNRVAGTREQERELLSVEDILGEVVQGFQALRSQGKVRFYGITGFGETQALLGVVDSGAMYSVQTCYNLLNPTSGTPAPAGFDLQDFGGLINHAEAQGTGVLVIRVLAAGALTGVEERHPVAAASVAPMGTSESYSQDLGRTQRLRFLVNQGYADSLVEAAIRFPLANTGVSSVLVGYSSMEHLEDSVRWAAKGPLPSEAMAGLRDAWAQMPPA